MRATGNDDDRGILRIDFRGGACEDRLGHISWDEWFEKFDENNLAFVDQDDEAVGEPSTFFKLVKRERVGAGR